jgi:beta-glucanase (GH16 family)
VHTNETALHEGATGNAVQAAVPDAETAFHTYGLQLSPDHIVWTIDGEEYHRVKKTSDDPMKWPFTPDNQFKAILNLAMGGDSAGPIDDAGQPWKFEIEKVSFFEYAGTK